MARQQELATREAGLERIRVSPECSRMRALQSMRPFLGSREVFRQQICQEARCAMGQDWGWGGALRFRLGVGWRF